MNFNQIFSEIEKADTEVFEKLDTRRNTMRDFAKTGGKIALAALPFAFGSMFNKAYAGQRGSMMPSIVDVLNFALTLEYLESQFYVKGVNTPNLIPNPPVVRMSFKDIREDELAHVAFLQATIISLGGTPVPSPTFDFTGGGLFPDVFTNFSTFLAVSQTFEDTGVRAYKGQATNLMSNNDVLTAALRIHSVEARHASAVRSLRSLDSKDQSIKPWITGNSTAGIGAVVAPNYAGEENTNQLGIEIVGINGYDISFSDATEAFDEPLTMDQVLMLVSPFIVAPS